MTNVSVDPCTTTKYLDSCTSTCTTNTYISNIYYMYDDIR